MAIDYTPATLTPISLGAAANAATWNSVFTQIINSLTTGAFDLYPRHVVVSMAAGESIAAGDFVRVSGATILKTDTGSDAGITAFLGVALETKTIGVATKVATNGLYGTSGLTAGAIYYLSTSGTITSTKPTSRAKPIGMAISTTTLIFLPNLDSNVTFPNLNVTGTITGLFGAGSDGTNGGNGQQQASIAVPTGSKMAKIYVYGDYYNGVSGAHTGFWEGAWRASSNTITTITDISHAAGNNQSFTVNYSAGNIVVTNNTGLTANQSGVVRIIFS